ncbi:PREDICTED: eukaryotic translation initiation factor 3 subunit G [Nanorana parkeri]|uniref:eukaryotic translation initiation factor 3 subunit G n=1 Tax=Nanorana parkeri TaxID=125878 RepID=UPI000854E3AD|nr:PREDICTED: eukaryotic translation initiation factor 3 subunit G [Nanorana parkeri]
MPTGDYDSKPSWADQVEEEGDEAEDAEPLPLPLPVPKLVLDTPKEVINGKIKTITEYKLDENDKKIKIIRTFKVETLKASKVVARRKDGADIEGGVKLDVSAWVFGCPQDTSASIQPPSPDSSVISSRVYPKSFSLKHVIGPAPSDAHLTRVLGHTDGASVFYPTSAFRFSLPSLTVPGPAPFIHWISALSIMKVRRLGYPNDCLLDALLLFQDLNSQEEEDPMNKLKGQKIVSCRICKGDHWTTRCPYKDTLGPMQKELAEQLGLSTADKEKVPGAEPEPAQAPVSKTGKYVPPSLRPTADDNATIRVTNLSEDTRETDLQELFRPFGSISRIYLAKDKTTGQSKGFAFISFHRREDAARAIAGVSGFGYDHLILNVEWAKYVLIGCCAFLCDRPPTERGAPSCDWRTESISYMYSMLIKYQKVGVFEIRGYRLSLEGSTVCSIITGEALQDRQHINIIHISTHKGKE